MIRKNLLRVLCLGLLLLGVGASLLGFAQTPVQLKIQPYWEVSAETTWPVARAMWQMAAKFQELNKNVKIEFVYVPFGELVATLARQAMVKELPEIVFADNPDVRYLAAAGVYRDITGRVNQWGQWKDFFVGSRLAVSLKGKVYAVHLGTNNVALYYNKDYFKRLGITPPTTWEELLKVCQIITDKLGKEGVYAIGFSAIDTEELTWQFEPFLWSNNGSLLELDKPPAIEALKLWVTLFQKGYAHPDVTMWGQGGDIVDQFMAGHTAMSINGPWILAQLRENKKVDYGIVPLPVPKKGATLVVPMGGETFGLGASIASEKVDAAWKFIQFFTSPENMAQYCLSGGYVPTRASAVPLVIAKDPELEVFAKQAAKALPRPPMGGDQLYPQVSAITRRYIQLAMAGELTPEKAFQQASAEIRKLFASEKEYQAAVSQARQVLAEVRGTR